MSLKRSEPEDTLTVTDNRTGKRITIPITQNSIPATAFKALNKQLEPENGEREEDEVEGGIRVYDPGFMNTAVIQSTITFIDGEKGILRYRGYPIEQLATSSTFLETAFLLLYGELPSTGQYELFSKEIMHHTFLHRDVDEIVAAFRYDAHPMSILASTITALGSFAPEANPSLVNQNLFTTQTSTSFQIMDKQIFRLIGKSITIAAMCYRIRMGRGFNKPLSGNIWQSKYAFTESFLYMMDHLNDSSYTPHPVIAKALDTLFLLHADHEMNASCAAVLQVGSTLVDPYSAVGAGCAALYGPLHGGANEAVIRMLMAIGSPDNVPAYIERVKKKEVVLSGFGHRIYRTSDPRSKVIRQIAQEVFEVTGKDELLDIAIKLHDVAISDEYFVSRRLYPNVDFWSGLIYRACGFPTDFFPVLFAVPRIVGWLSHWRQMMLQKNGVKIWRPRQIYQGSEKRDYVPINSRVKAAKKPVKDGQKGGEPGEPSIVPHTFTKRLFLPTEPKPKI